MRYFRADFSSARKLPPENIASSRLAAPGSPRMFLVFAVLDFVVYKLVGKNLPSLCICHKCVQLFYSGSWVTWFQSFKFRPQYTQKDCHLASPRIHWEQLRWKWHHSRGYSNYWLAISVATFYNFFYSVCLNRVLTDHGKPEKSWNFVISFSRPGKSWNLGVGHGKSWKISMLSVNKRQ